MTRRTLLLILAAATIAALAAAYLLTAGRGGSGTDSARVPAGVPTYDSGNVSDATVWVDGWSEKILAGARLHQVPARTADSNANTTNVDLAPLTPATADDLRALADRAPDRLTDLVARTITADSALACTSGGCTTSTGETIPLEWLTSPEKVPGLGAVYRQWGITSLAWHTSVHTPDATTPSVTIGADTFDTATVSLDRDAGSAADTTLASGLGRLFPLAPGWKGRPGERFAPNTPAGAAPAPAVSAAPSDPALPPVPVTPDTPTTPIGADSGPLGLGGLPASASAAAAGFNASQLTYYTSPTTGCSAFTCTPAVLDPAPTVTSDTYTDVKVCSTRAGSAATATVRVEDTRYTADYPHPTVQAGLWSGAAPDSFAGRLNGDWLWAGNAPTVTGPVGVRLVRYWYLTSGAPWQVLATVYQDGADTVPGGYDPASAASVDKKDTDWKTCG